MSKVLNIGNDLYLKGRIGWKGLSKNEYLEHGEYKIINATALMDGYVDWENCSFISEERYLESKDIMLEENDILISKDGTLGKIGYVKNLTNPTTVASGIFVLRNTIPDDLDFTYLYHLLKSKIFKDFIERNKATGSTINHLYQRDLANFEISLPPLEEQRKIANYLSNLDNQIELNNRINKELEEAAQTLYNYWFVQFEFPNEEGNPYKSSGGKMIWNEELKREIPVGWEVKNIKDIANDVWGNCPPGKNILEKESNEEGSLPYCSGAGDMPSDSWTVAPKAKTNKPTRIAKEWDTLISVAGTIGKTVFSTEEIAIGRATLGLQPIDYKYKSFIFLLMRSYCSHFNTVATGAIQKIINKTHLEEVNFAFNPNLKEFESLNMIYEIILSNSKQNQELSQLRDYMLPLLMSGQVTIED